MIPFQSLVMSLHPSQPILSVSVHRAPWGSIRLPGRSRGFRLAHVGWLCGLIWAMLGLAVQAASTNTHAFDMGARIRGSLAAAGDVDIYKFGGLPGRRLYFDGISGSAITARLTSPSGRVLFDVGLVNDFGPLTTLESGSYELRVGGAGAAKGGYEFRLLDSDQAPVTLITPPVVLGGGLFPVPARALNVTGTYFNGSLRSYSAQDDWRITQKPAGKRQDTTVDFVTSGWGMRSAVGLTNGTDANWERFSVQWDGTLTVRNPGTHLYLRSDDGSRMWIDLNGDGVFASEGPEFMNNNWGNGQGATTGAPSVSLAAGSYRIRIQYEEESGDNEAHLLWDDGAAIDPGVQIDMFRLSLRAGDRVGFLGTNTTVQGGYVWLYGPQNNLVFSGSSLGWFEGVTASSGEHLLVIGGNGTNSFPYQVGVAVGERRTLPLALGSEVQGRIRNPADQDLYTFSAIAGQRVYFDVFGTNTDGIRAHLVGPDGDELLNQGMVNPRPEPQTLLRDGVYTLRIESVNAGVGPYSFRLVDLASKDIPSVEVGRAYGISGVPASALDVRGTYFNASFRSKPAAEDWRESELSSGTREDSVLQFISNGWGRRADIGVTGGTDDNWDNFSVQWDGRVTVSSPGTRFYLRSDDGSRLWLDVDHNGTFGNTVSELLDNHWGSAQSATMSGPSVALNPGAYPIRVHYEEGNGDNVLSLLWDQGERMDPGSRARIYRVPMAAGQRLYLTATGPYTPLADWALYAPNNAYLGGSGLSYSFQVTPPATGDGYLVLKGNTQEAVGFGFRVTKALQRESTLVLDAVTAGTIAELGESHRWTFSGKGGRWVFFDGITGASGITARLESPSAVIQNYLSPGSDTGPIFLPEDGSYRLIVDGQGTYTGSYAFRLLDASGAPAVGVGSRATGALPSLRQVVVHRLTGGVGRRVELTASTANPREASWSLVSPSGEVLMTRNLASDLGQVFLSEPGDYLVVLYGQGSTDTPSNYLFNVKLVEAPTGVPSGLGTVLSGTVGGTVTNRYPLHLVLGQRLYLDSQEPSANGVVLDLRDNTGTNAAVLSAGASADGGVYFVPRSGDYTLQVRGTGTYRFRLLDLDAATPIAPGGDTQAILKDPYETVAYTFKSDAGHRWYYDALSGDFDAVYARLYGPDGRNVFVSGNADSDVGPFTVPDAGTWSLVIESRRTAAVTQRFRLLDVSGAQSVAAGKTVAGSLVAPRSAAILAVPLNPGERLYFRSQGTNAAGYWNLYGPRDSSLGGSSIGSPFEVDATPGGNGILLLQNNTDAAIGYAFTLFRSVQVESILSLDEVNRGLLANPGDRASFTFQGTPGQRLIFDGIEGKSMVLTVVAPSGGTVLSRTMESDANPFTLREAGTYTVWVDGSSDAIGSFAFRLLDVARQPVLNLGQGFSRVLDPGFSSAAYRILGTAGQSLYFKSQGTNAPGSWYLFGTSDAYLAGSSISGDFEATLPRSGTYVLLIQGASPVSISVKAMVRVEELSKAEIDPSAAQTAVINGPGDKAQFRFSGRPGEFFLYDSLATPAPAAGISVFLRAPSGSTPWSYPASSDSGLLQLAEAGDFALEFDGGGAATGSVGFRFLRLLDQPSLRLSVPTAATLPAGGISQVYRLEASALQPLSFRLLSKESISANLYAPSGAYVRTLYSTANTNAAPSTFDADRSGTYVLVLSGPIERVAAYSLLVASRDGSGTPNTPPNVVGLRDLSVAGGTSIVQSFSVIDLETAPERLTVVATSSNPALLPSSGLALSGTGSARSLKLTPVSGQSGSVRVRLTVTDEAGATGTAEFTLVVTASNSPPSVDSIEDQFTTDGRPVGPIPVFVDDVQTPASSLVVSAFSSNPGLLPSSGLVFGGVGRARFLTLFPRSGETGLAQVTVRVSDGRGGSADAVFRLTVSAAPPTLLATPGAQTVPAGSTARFEVLATGTAPLTYQWSLNSLPLVGETQARLTLSKVSSTNSGLVRVTVRNAAGQVTSDPVLLRVLSPPSILGQPASQAVPAGAAVTFTVSVGGAGPFSYQWLFNGQPLPGETRSTLVLASVSQDRAGKYRVLVSGPDGVAQSDAARLVVTGSALDLQDLFARRATVTTPSGSGQSDNLKATHEAGEPLHAGKPGNGSVWLQWIAPVSGLARFDTRGSGFDTLLAVYLGTSFQSLQRVAADDDSGGFSTSLVQFPAIAGVAYQIAVDGLGNARGDVNLSWQVTPGPVTLPQVLTVPFDLTVAQGAAARFSVLATNLTTALGNLTFQWLRNGVPVAGATAASLDLTSVTPGQVGVYSVRISNAVTNLVVGPFLLQINESEGAVADTRIATRDKLADALALAESASAGPAKAGPGVPPLRPSGAALARGYSGAQVFNTFGSGSEDGEPSPCGVVGGASQWFSYTPATAGLLTLSTEGSDFDTVLAVYTGPGTDFESLQSLGCDNNGGPDGRTSRLSLPVDSGVTYFVAVDGVNGATGSVRLTYHLDGPATLALDPGVGGGVDVRMTGTPGLGYTLQGSDGLVEWFPILTTNLVNGVVRFPDPSPGGTPLRFFRAVSIP